MKPSNGYRHFVILTTGLICLVYLVYRGVWTLNLTTWYAVCASLLLFVGECFTIVLGLLYFLQVWQVQDPPEEPVLEGRTVDVLVPTYSEDAQLLRATLQACIAMDYPHTTYVLDDGRRPEIEALANELGIPYVTRPDNKFAKAGNLNHALEMTTGEFVIVLDADHVPERNFITRTIGYFADDDLAYVQTPHAFYNFDSFQAVVDHEKRRYWEEGQLFYNVVQPGRNLWNSAIFAGSGTIFRRAALQEIGYIAVETITEDLHTGLRLHARGWKSLAITERLLAGQAAPDVTTFHSQRLRWGEGNLSIFAYDNPLIMRGLTIAQRLCYIGSMLHWAGGLFLLTIYLTPLLMLFTGVPPVKEFNWILGTAIAVYLFASFWAARITSYGYWSFWNSQLFNMAGFYTQIRGTLRAVFRRRFQKFVVTSKRGRQSKSVWPFIWPYVALIFLSVLALVWGWARPLWGISDDWQKPILASAWTVFHICLALAVIHRSLWPDNQRFAYRHDVCLPVAYRFAPAGADEKHGFGVSTDLNDTGLAMVAYESVPVGSIMQITLHGGGDTIDMQAKVCWSKRLDARTRSTASTLEGYRLGLAFEQIDANIVDRLNRICMSYGVSKQYSDFTMQRASPLLVRFGLKVQRRFNKQRAAKRHGYHLPLILKTPDGQASYTVTEDMSRTALTALLNRELPDGTEVSFVLPLPGGDIRGTARITRGEQRTLGTETYHRYVFDLARFEGQGRLALQALLNPPAREHLSVILKPRREPVQVPFARPVLIASALLGFLIAGQLAFFRYHYRDEFFLSEIIASHRALDNADQERLEQIYQATIVSDHPSSDRLSLLVEALSRTQHPRKLAEVAQVLSRRDPSNTGLQLAYAQALDASGSYLAARAEYESLLAQMKQGKLPAARQGELLLAAARASFHAGHTNDALELYRQAYEKFYPSNPAVRAELAGVLLQAGKFNEARQLYAGVNPDAEGRFLLANIDMLAGDLDRAEQEARTLLALKPDDLRVELLLANILGKQKNFAQARRLLDRLLERYPDDPQLRVQLGRNALASGNVEQALQVFQNAIERDDFRPDVLKGWIDSAAAAPDELLNLDTAKLVDKHIDGTPLDQDAAYLARLAWVFQRFKQSARSLALLEEALEYDAKSEGIRKQYVGALLVAGHWQRAVEFLRSGPLDDDTRRLLVDVHLSQHDFAGAEKQCRDILARQPDDLTIKKRLADILSWQQKYKEALALFQEVLKAKPDDPDVPRRIAEVTLWSKDYAQALRRFRALVEGSPDRADLLPGYAQAALNVPAEDLTQADLRLIPELAAKALAAPRPDALLEARLAWLEHRRDPKAEVVGKLFERAVGEPAEPGDRKQIAGLAAGAGRYDLAIAIYRDLTLDTEDRLLLASFYAGDKQFGEAAKQYRAILAKDPDNSRAERGLADVLVWNKDYAEALQLLDRLLRSSPDDRTLQVRRAQATLWSGDFARAVPLFRPLLLKTPGDKDLQQGFIDAAAGAPSLSGDDAQAALELFQRFRKDPPDDVLMLSRLAWVLHRVGQQTESVDLAERALALKPQQPAVRKELAGVLGALHLFPQALELYKGLELDDNDRLNLARLYAGNKDFKLAEAEIRKVVEARPDDKSAQLLLGDVLSWGGSYKEAAEIYRKLGAAKPDDQQLALRLARVLLWEKEYDQALARFQKLLDKDFADAELWRGFVDAAASADKLDPRYKPTALKIYEKVMAKVPNDPVFLARLAWVLRRSGEKQKSIDLLETALSVNPKSKQIILQLAEALYDAGRIPEAKEYFEEVLKRSQK